jgi:hypothetical protein
MAFAPEERPISDDLRTDEVYPNELLPSGLATEAEIDEADEPYPMVIRSVLSSPVPTPLTDKPGVEESSRPILSYIEPAKIPGSYQVSQIQKSGVIPPKDDAQSSARADWQPQHFYTGQQADQDGSPFTRRLGLYHAPINWLANITRRSISGVKAILAGHQPYMTASEAKTGLERPTQPRYLPPIADKPEEVTPHQASVRIENQSLPDSLEGAKDLSYPLTHRGTTAVLRALSKRPSLAIIPRAIRRLNKPVFNLLPLDRLVSRKESGSLPARVGLQRVPEISRARLSAAPVSRLTEVLFKKFRTRRIAEDAAGMRPGQDMVAATMPEGLPTSELETTSVYREPSSVESVSLTPARPVPPYFKLAGSAMPPGGTENYDFRWKEEYEPPSLRNKDAGQSALELPLTSSPFVKGIKGGEAPLRNLHPSSIMKGRGIKGEGSAENLTSDVPWQDVSTTHNEEWLSSIFEGTIDHERQIMPETVLIPVGHAAEAAPPATSELALAAVGRPAEVATPARTTAETRGEAESEEVSAPDVDNIARDVYSILKRRLARERERAQGY